MAHHRHRPFQALAAAALLVALAPLAFGALLRDPAQLAGAYFGFSLAAYLWAAAGTLVAAHTFARGEAMRPGWLLLSLGYAALVPGRLLAGPGWAGLGEASERLPMLLAAGNVASSALVLGGFLLLARAWRSSGLDLTSPASRMLMQAGALALSVALAGPDLVERSPAALGGDPLAVTDVLTDLLDGALFVVAVPVLRAALALGGGLVAWPWALLTLSLLAWLGFDASLTWGDALGLSPRNGRVLEEVMRTLGTTAVLAASLAQRWVMSPLPDGDAPPPAA
jgi:hypothetical protein